MTEKALGPPWPERPALFLDLDGTLIDFAATPDAVEPSVRLRTLIARLAKLEDGALAVISGRAIAALDAILAPHRLAAAGLHGIERRRANGSVVPPALNAGALDSVRRHLQSFALANEGIHIEDKALALAIHYRQAPALAESVARLGIDIAPQLPEGWELLAGNHVLEIKPAHADKGDAIRAFMSEPPFVGRTPIFVGDDVTDEHGFRVVNDLGGVSIKVAGGATAAQWRLEDVAAVMSWLEAHVPS